MKNYTYTITKIPIKKTVCFKGKFKLRLPAIIAIIFFSITVSAQPVLINPSITCSSLDKLNVEGCYRAALEFNGDKLTADVAALYTSNNLPVTVTLENTAAGSSNNYRSWSFTYTYKIEDASSNFVTCDVVYSGNDNIKPRFTVPPDINLYQTANCDLFFPDTAIAGHVTDAFDECGIWQVLFLDCGDRKGTGTYATAAPCPLSNCLGQNIVERTWIVLDSAENVAVGLQRIYILDTIRPVFTVFPSDFTSSGCQGLTYDVEAIDNCSGIADLSYTFSGATTGSGNGSGSGSTFNFGATTVTIKATDCVGNINQRSFIVTVTCDPNIYISISAGITRTIYTGLAPGGAGPFGPQSINLCSNVTGGTPGYTYSWTPTAGLNDPHIANPVASPTVTTPYLLLVTDHNGDTATLSITINVLPLSSLICTGNGNNVKYRVCHIPPGNPSNPQNICISANALNAHLLGGGNGHNNCHLGYCGEQLCFSTRPGGCQGTCQPSNNNSEGYPLTDAAGAMNSNAELTVIVSPNPSDNNFNIRVISKSNEPVMVRILDNNGVVRSVSGLSAKANSILVGSNLNRGVYIAEVIQGNNRQVVKLIKLN